jgi:hypothetical protein
MEDSFQRIVIVLLPARDVPTALQRLTVLAFQSENTPLTIAGLNLDRRIFLLKIGHVHHWVCQYGSCCWESARPGLQNGFFFLGFSGKNDFLIPVNQVLDQSRSPFDQIVVSLLVEVLCILLYLMRKFYFFYLPQGLPFNLKLRCADSHEIQGVVHNAGEFWRYKICGLVLLVVSGRELAVSSLLKNTCFDSFGHGFA